MAYYKTCPICGGNLDPGEICDCQEDVSKMRAEREKNYAVERKTGQYTLLFREESLCAKTAY